MGSMRTRTLLVVGLAVALAGCSGFLSPDSSPATPTPAEPTSVVSTPTPTPAEPTSVAPTPTPGVTSDTTTSAVTLSEVPLYTSDLPSPYESRGELELSRENATGADADRFEQRDLTYIVERTHIAPDGDNTQPEIIFSSALRYRSSSAAATDLDSIVAGLRDSGATVSERAITDTMTATVLTFENDRGYQNTAYYGRVGDVVFYVVTSDADRHHDERTEELFTEMLLDL